MRPRSRRSSVRSLRRGQRNKCGRVRAIQVESQPVAVAGKSLAAAPVAARFVEALTALCYQHEGQDAVSGFAGLLTLAVPAVHRPVSGAARHQHNKRHRPAAPGYLALSAFPVRAGAEI